MDAPVLLSDDFRGVSIVGDRDRVRVEIDIGVGKVVEAGEEYCSGEARVGIGGMVGNSFERTAVTADVAVLYLETIGTGADAGVLSTGNVLRVFLLRPSGMTTDRLGLVDLLDRGGLVGLSARGQLAQMS